MEENKEIKMEDVQDIVILITLPGGDAHQVLASRVNKRIALRMIAGMEDGLRLSEEIEPVTFEPKK